MIDFDLSYVLDLSKSYSSVGTVGNRQFLSVLGHYGFCT